MKIINSGKKAFLLTLCLLIASICVKSAPATVFDFDGDGKTDILVTRLDDKSNNYIWYMQESQNGFAASIWGGISGSYGDSSVSADYDGDGKTDIAVIRNRGGSEPYYWYILNSRDNTMTAVQWGLSLTDRPVPQDYDGDGKTDIAVYRSGTWYILQSSNNQLYAEQFGRSGIVGTDTPSDKPLRGGDYDGDGKADLAVVRYTAPATPGGSAVPMTLLIRRSSDRTWASYDLGDARYTGVLTGDYDGDGRADVAIWQGNLWLWIRSSDNKLDGVRFGIPGVDMPAPGDYDGDGKTDPAVFRRDSPQSYFYILQSKDGFKAVQWGNNTDTAPITFDYIRAVGF